MSDSQTFIQKNPNATTKEKAVAVAESLVGSATEIYAIDAESFGLPEGWDIIDEPVEVCEAFDQVAMRCEDCGWWFNADDISGGVCNECNPQEDDR